MKVYHLLLAALALYGRTAVCQEDEDYDGDMAGADDDYGGGGGEEDYGGDDGGGAPSTDLQELTSIEEFDAFLDNADASIIGAFNVKEMPDPDAVKPEGWDDDEDGEWSAPTVENPQLASLKTIASSNYGYRFAFTTSADVLEKKLKQKSSMGLYIYRSPKFLSPDKAHGDRPRERFPSDKLTESAVGNWLAAKTQPLVGQFSSTTKDRYKTPTLVIFMNLDFEKNAKGIEYVLKRARKAALGLKGKLAFAVASLSEMSYDLEDYGLVSNHPGSDVLMAIRADASYDGKKYGAATGTKFSGNTLSEFANDYLAGKLTAHVRPDPPPSPPYDENDEGMGDDGDYGNDESGEEDEAKDEM